MKPRRVFVTLEIETDMSSKYLKFKDLWSSLGRAWTVEQVQVNVAKQSKKARKKA